MHTLFRLRDTLALTRPELMAIGVLSALVAGGLVVPRLPAPPSVLSPDVVAYDAAVRSTPDAAPAAIPENDVRASEQEAAPDVAPTRRAKAMPGGIVDLNTASAAQLETLPRIGPKMAERILAYRAQRGGFRSVDELRNVKGIGAKTLENLRPFVSVGG